MALDGKSGKVIREAIENYVKSLVRTNVEKAPFNKTKNGRIVSVSPTGYTVEIENKEYPNVQAINATALQVNDIVVCSVPNNQMSQMYIIGKLVSFIAVSGGGVVGTVVLVNGVPVTTLSFTSDPQTQLNNKADISSLASYLPLAGGTMTGTLTLASLDEALVLPNNSMIKTSISGSLRTVYGYDANTNTFIISSPYAITNIRGQGTRPTYNGSEIALLSDIPTIYITDVKVNGASVVSGDVAELTADTTPTQNSTNLITSGAVYASLQDYVTLNTTQTIAGAKTFTADIVRKNTSYAYSDAPTSASVKSILFTDKNNVNLAVIQTALGSTWNAINFILRNKANTTTTLEYVADDNGVWRFDPVTDNLVNLGTSTRRWKNLYLAGNIYSSAGVPVLQNPNLLINSNFVINQREASSYGGTAYGVDHWRMSYGTLTPLAGGGFKHTTANTWQGVLQTLENPSHLAGKTVTISGNGYAGTGGYFRIYLYYKYADQSRVTVATAATNSSTPTTISATGTIPSDITENDTIYFQIYNNIANTDMYCNWVKLEVGSVATAYTPPLIAEELPKCQRYYFKIIQTNMLVNGFTFSATNARFSLYFPCEMRQAPTMTLGTSVSTCKTYHLGSIATPTAVSIQSSSKNAVALQTTGTYTANNSISLRFLQQVSFDAEIY